MWNTILDSFRANADRSDRAASFVRSMELVVGWALENGVECPTMHTTKYEEIVKEFKIAHARGNSERMHQLIDWCTLSSNDLRIRLRGHLRAVVPYVCSGDFVRITMRRDDIEKASKMLEQKFVLTNVYDG